MYPKATPPSDPHPHILICFLSTAITPEHPMKTTQLLSLSAVSLLASQVAGHGHMTQPKGRTTTSFGDPQDKSACDSDKPGLVTSFASGEEIQVEWNRNNHIGGFIRYSIAPKNAVSKATFDANAFFYTCRESDCTLKHCKDKFCGDDSGAKDNEIKCRAKIKLPDYLEKGDYVLQWTWHAAGSSYGNVGWSTSNFKTCADIKLTTSGTGQKPTCPTFIGGDRVTALEKNFNDTQRTSQCFYFDDNGLGKGIVKYSDSEGYKRYMFGIPKEVQKCGGGASTPSFAGNSTTPSTAPASGSSKTPTPAAPKPVTTTPTPTTGAPSPSSNDDDDGGNSGKSDDGKDDGPQSDGDDDAPGTVAPWRQVADSGRRWGGGRRHGSDRGNIAKQSEW